MTELIEEQYVPLRSVCCTCTRIRGCIPGTKVYVRHSLYDIIGPCSNDSDAVCYHGKMHATAVTVQ